MTPTIGRIVLYKLTEQDAAQINRRRTDGDSIRERIATDPPQWPVGAQAHIGQHAREGEELPMIVTKVISSEQINGQVFLNGNDTYWVVGAGLGEGHGEWNWPPRV